MDDLYKVKQFEAHKVEGTISTGKISEKEKFIAAKQILLGLAILYILTVIAFILKPNEGGKLLDITTVTFPPLATLILAAYFRDKGN
ncbi:MAG: hypothetical protein Q8936_14230 [Bacillota bacterium]|nr:hypothetical protein [Bacillota bacterium]